MRRLSLAALLAWGCEGADDPGASCPIDLPSECEPLYEPIFEEVHARTFAESCALSGCHDAESAQGGLELDVRERAWSELVEDGRVIPGDPGCSPLMMRLHGAGVPIMPPGRPLSAAERCAVQRWIEQGASP